MKKSTIKNKLSHSILRYLYRNNCIGNCDLKPFLKSTGNTESKISAAVAILKEKGWVETTGDWTFLGSIKQGNKITIDNSHLHALITESGINYYKGYIDKKYKLKWIPIWASIIAIIISVLGLFIASDKSQVEILKIEQENIKSKIMKFSHSLDSLNNTLIDDK